MSLCIGSAGWIPSLLHIVPTSSTFLCCYLLPSASRLLPRTVACSLLWLVLNFMLPQVVCELGLVPF